MLIQQYFTLSCTAKWKHWCAVLAGRGTLQQIGLLTPSPTLVLTLTLLFSGATVFAFGRTLKRALTKDMSPTCAACVAMLHAIFPGRHKSCVI